MYSSKILKRAALETHSLSHAIGGWCHLRTHQRGAELLKVKHLILVLLSQLLPQDDGLLPHLIGRSTQTPGRKLIMQTRDAYDGAAVMNVEVQTSVGKTCWIVNIQYFCICCVSTQSLLISGKRHHDGDIGEEHGWWRSLKVHRSWLQNNY